MAEYLAAFTSDGTLRWVHRFELGEQGYVGALELTDDAAWVGGAIDTTGTFASDTSMHSVTLTTETPGTDAFITRYTLDGVVVWAELVARGPGSQGVRSLAASPAGGILALGLMEGDTAVGTTSVSRTLHATGTSLFAMHLDSAGGRSCRATAP